MGKDQDTLVGFGDLDALMAEAGIAPLKGRPTPAPRAAPPQTTPPRAAPPAAASPKAPPPAAPREQTPVMAVLAAQVAELNGRVAELQKQLQAMTHERDTLDQQRRGLQRRLAEATPAEAPPEAVPLAAVLDARGLAADERAEALLALLGDHPAALLDALPLADGGALTALLDERIVLSCGGPACAVPEGASVLRVPADRCEICGGSDVRRAFRAFTAACAGAAVQRVVIVGGSPAYRRALTDLAEADRPSVRLELVSGVHKASERRVRGLARNADLVIIWASTILDHATSNAFDAAGGRRLTVPHRGIATMLNYAAEQLGGARRG